MRRGTFDLARIRSDFPALRIKASATSLTSSSPIIYLDNAATTHKPQVVISAEGEFYERSNANIHRAVHELSQKATAQFENVREQLQSFLNASSTEEIIFTKSATESINLVAATVMQSRVKSGQEILVTEMEHHSNIVPWQLHAARAGASVIAAQVSGSGEIDKIDFASKLSSKTALVSFVHLSNSLGTLNPVSELIALVREKAPHALILVDGSQYMAHATVDVQTLGADFYVFSAHKMFGPTGVGILYGRKQVLESLPPFLGGGDMIETVSFNGSTFAGLPHRFEAGTPNIAGVIAFGAALSYLETIDRHASHAHEIALVERLVSGLAGIENVKVIGAPPYRMGAVSFVIPNKSSIDIGIALNNFGFAVRTGHHCCMPVMKRLGLDGTVRASVAMYNTHDEISAFIDAVKSVAHPLTTVASPSCTDCPFDIYTSVDTLPFARASAPSVQQAAKGLLADFDLLEELQERQEYLIELGNNHPQCFGSLKALAPRVNGCMSEVYVVCRVTDDGIVQLIGDSNAYIVRGLLAMLERLYAGQPVEQVAEFDIQDFFKSIRLPEFLSTQRRSGLIGVLTVIKQAVEEFRRGTGDAA